MPDLATLLRKHGIQATPQRVAVARFVLGTQAHPSADEVYARVREICPRLSRATVYNTLNLMAEKGLLRILGVREGAAVFDARVERHHHLIDADTGRIHDVPWDALTVSGGAEVDGFEVQDYQVVLRGRKRKP